MDTEEETLMSMEESKEVFLNTIKKVNDLQASFSKVYTKENSGLIPVNDTNSSVTDSVSKDKADQLSGSEGLLQAFKQLKRLDCLVAKNQEARRVEDALRNTIKSEEVLQQLCSVKSKKLKSPSGVEEAAVDCGLLLPKGQVEKGIPIPTAQEAFSVPLAKESFNENPHSSDNLEIITGNSNKTENNTSHNNQEIKPSQHFIKRNIKLATEGHRMGSLATITDEERIQLDCLLKDLEQQEQTLVNGEAKGNQAFGDRAYSICFDTMGSILDIDTKLEKINKERYSKGDRQYFNKVKLAGFQDSEVDEKRLWKGADAAMNMKRRLTEINKSLHNLNEPSKEVQPIDEARIQQLVDEFCGKFTDDGEAGSSLEKSEGSRVTDTFGCENTKATSQENEGKEDKGIQALTERVISSERVKEIVELTKSQMPCFKFKHQ